MFFCPWKHHPQKLHTLAKKYIFCSLPTFRVQCPKGPFPAENDHMTRLLTLLTSEILSGKNAQAFLVCGILMKLFKKKYPENMKKIMGAVWKLPAK